MGPIGSRHMYSDQYTREGPKMPHDTRTTKPACVPDSPVLYRARNGRVLAGAGLDQAGRPTYWSRQTKGRRVLAGSFGEAQRRARLDAEVLDSSVTARVPA